MMIFEEVMYKLESLANEQAKKICWAHGIHEPHWGISIACQKDKRNQPLGL